jgi:transposase
VRDRLTTGGWEVEVADARQLKTIAPLACKTDRVDARVLAELCRRDVVPALWMPSLEERALRERLRRCLHLVRLRSSAKNRVFGLLTQWGLRLAWLRQPDGLELVAAHAVHGVWRRSIGEALAMMDYSTNESRRSTPRCCTRAGRPAGRAARHDFRDRHAARSHDPPPDRPGRPLLRSPQGDRLRRARPKVHQWGERSRSERSKAGSRALRWAAVEAAQHAGRSPHYRELYQRTRQRHGKRTTCAPRTPDARTY